nr:60S ribosomal protein L13a-4 [Tanacetum cinerariifolium]
MVNGSGICAKEVVVDARHHMLGRLSSILAKELLNGQKVTVVRCEEICLSGGLVRQKMKYLRFLRKRMNTKPSHGPIHFRAPSKILWRTIRGMIPHKTKRGAAALARLKVYEGVPTPYNRKKRMVIPDALKVLRLTAGHKYCLLGKLSSEVGWNHYETIKELEKKRKEKSQVVYERKKQLNKLRAKAEKAAEEKLGSQLEIREILENLHELIYTLGLRVSEEQRLIEEEEADELYRDVDINQGRGLQVSQDIEDSHVTLTPIQPDGVESIFTTASSSIAPIQTSTLIMTSSTISIIITSSEAPIPPTTIPSAVLENLPTFDSVFCFEDRVKSLEVNFSEFMQTNQFAEAVSKIPVQIQTDRLQDSFQRENDEFLRAIDENMKKIIKGQVKGQVKSQVKEQVLRILPRIEESTTGTQSRQMSASEFAFAEEPVQTTCQMDEPPHPVFETGVEDQLIVKTSQHPEWFSQPRKLPTPDRDWNKTLPAIQGSAQTWISELAKQADSRSSFNELLDTPIDFSNFIMNRLGVDTLTPELLAGPTYELLRGSCTSLTELEYHLEEVYKATTDQLDWVNPEGLQYPHNLLQPLLLIPDNRGRRVIPFAHFINNDIEYLWGGASSRKYTTSVTMTKTKAADYGHINLTELEYHLEEIYKATTDQLDWVNPEAVDQEINANMVFMAQIEKVLSDSEASSSSADEKISESCMGRTGNRRIDMIIAMLTRS